MLLQDLAVPREVVLLEGGLREGCFGIQEPVELGDQGVSLGQVSRADERTGARPTFSNISWSLDSVCRSSSVGFGGMFGTDANCEYV